MRYLAIFSLFILFGACSGNPNPDASTTTVDSSEMTKVDQLQKSDKQKEDSVRAYWENKMEQSKIGDDETESSKR